MFWKKEQPKPLKLTVYVRNEEELNLEDSMKITMLLCNNRVRIYGYKKPIEPFIFVSQYLDLDKNRLGKYFEQKEVILEPN